MNDCDVQYKSSKNQRLTVELAIMRICALHKAPDGSAIAAPQKKKPLAQPPEPKQVQEVAPAPTPPTAEVAEEAPIVAEPKIELTSTPEGGSCR